MKKFKSMQIHSGCSSYSSRDVFIYCEIYDDPSDAIDQFGDDHIKVFCYDDKTYYSTRFDATKEQIESLSDKYVKQGWLTKRPKEIDEYLDRFEKKRIAERIAEGYVFTNYDTDWKDRDTIKGGFSDELWNLPHCVSYTSRPCFGYYGHSCRKPNLDACIEQSFKNIGASIEEIDYWLSSSYARHSADSLEGKSFEEQRKSVNDCVCSWLVDAKRMIEEKTTK